MGNTERNSYVRGAITRAAIALLEEKELEEISVSEICSAAEVSRNSFYRNFTGKEDIIKYHIRTLIISWDAQQNAEAASAGAQPAPTATSEKQAHDAALYRSLFAHMEQNADFYLLLKRRGLFHLFLTVFLDLFGLKTDERNVAAYAAAFIAYGTFGWIETWLERGMQETAAQMADLMTQNNLGN